MALEEYSELIKRIKSNETKAKKAHDDIIEMINDLIVAYKVAKDKAADASYIDDEEMIQEFISDLYDLKYRISSLNSCRCVIHRQRTDYF